MRVRENITVYAQGVKLKRMATTFSALSFKRINPQQGGWELEYLDLMVQTCYANREDEQERCCLPLKFQCDGSIDCWNGEKTVKFKGIYLRFFFSSLIRMKMIAMVAKLVWVSVKTKRCVCPRSVMENVKMDLLNVVTVEE